MFLAGSYTEIWGCLLYSVNIVTVTRQIQEIRNVIESPWAFNFILRQKNWVSLSSLGHRGSEKPNFNNFKITGYR